MIGHVLFDKSTGVIRLSFVSLVEARLARDLPHPEAE
jgi:hypothetical protein